MLINSEFFCNIQLKCSGLLKNVMRSDMFLCILVKPLHIQHFRRRDRIEWLAEAFNSYRWTSEFE